MTLTYLLKSIFQNVINQWTLFIHYTVSWDLITALINKNIQIVLLNILSNFTMLCHNILALYTCVGNWRLIRTQNNSLFGLRWWLSIRSFIIWIWLDLIGLLKYRSHLVTGRIVKFVWLILIVLTCIVYLITLFLIVNNLFQLLIFVMVLHYKFVQKVFKINSNFILRK